MTVIDHPTRHREQQTPRLQQDEPQQSGGPQSGGQREDSEVPPSIEVRAWWDPDLAIKGHELRGAYVERYWLGVLGPSVVFLLRRMARGLDEHPAGFRIDLADTARAIGLGGGVNRQSPIVRTIDRACMFGAMRRLAPDQLEVRTHLPRLTKRQLERLPQAVRRSHDAWLAHPANGSTASRISTPGDGPGPSAA